MNALLKSHFWDQKMDLLIFNLLGITINNKCPEPVWRKEVIVLLDEFLLFF